MHDDARKVGVTLGKRRTESREQKSKLTATGPQTRLCSEATADGDAKEAEKTGMHEACTGAVTETIHGWVRIGGLRIEHCQL